MTTAGKTARSDPVPRRRGRPANDTASAVRETDVLDLAFSTFAERGYEGTTVRELAKILGVSHNLLNVRFGTKADLWRRAVDSRVSRVAPPVQRAFDAPGLDDHERLRALVHSFCQWAADNPDFVGLANAEGRRATWRIAYLVDAYILPFKLQLEALLARVAVDRPVRALPASALLVLLVQGVGNYFASVAMLERLGSAGEIKPGHAERQVRAFADFILAGLLASDA